MNAYYVTVEYRLRVTADNETIAALAAISLDYEVKLSGVNDVGVHGADVVCITEEE